MFDKKDQIHAQNLVRLLNKAKMELEGQEILAAGDVLRWVGMLNQRIVHDLQQQETQAELLKGKETVKNPENAEIVQSLPDRAKKTNKNAKE
jgi:hypothetical protein